MDSWMMSKYFMNTSTVNFSLSILLQYPKFLHRKCSSGVQVFTRIPLEILQRNMQTGARDMSVSTENDRKVYNVVESPHKVSRVRMFDSRSHGLHTRRTDACQSVISIYKKPTLTISSDGRNRSTRKHTSYTIKCTNGRMRSIFNSTARYQHYGFVLIIVRSERVTS
jgi:hypothetical protein